MNILSINFLSGSIRKCLESAFSNTRSCKLRSNKGSLSSEIKKHWNNHIRRQEKKKFLFLFIFDLTQIQKNVRSNNKSHPTCSVRNGVLKSFANFTGKQLCWSLFLVKLRAYRCFPVKLAKFLRTTISKSICE